MTCPSTLGKSSLSQVAVLAGHLTAGVATLSLQDTDHTRNLHLNGPSRTLHTDEAVLIQGEMMGMRSKDQALSLLICKRG